MSAAPDVLRKAIRTLHEEGARAAVGKALARVQFFRNTLKASRRLRSLSRSPMDIEESLDFAFRFSIGEVTIAPAQIRSEIASLLGMLIADRPQRILEIGTARGGTLFLLSRVAQSNAVLASIDLPGGEFGGTYRTESILLLKALALEGQTLRLIHADSHEPTTFHAIRDVFLDQQLDFLLIDGDHRYEGVRSDFATYGPLVRPGGLIAMHDIVPGPTHLAGGVPTFWQEIRTSYECAEFVSAWNQQGFGIGVVVVPSQGVPEMINR
jgi:predicted O-methyltransferase YrrM